MFGLRLDYANRRICLNPKLPKGMTALSVRRLRLGSGMLEVEVIRNADGDFTIRMITNTTGWNIEEGRHDKSESNFSQTKVLY
jgi:hypothetical protein